MWIAATLRLPAHIRDGATTTGSLAAACGADEASLARLMAYLVGRGVFSETAGDYANTDVSDLLVDEQGWRSWFDLDGVPGIFAESWTRLLQAVRTGTPGRGEAWFYDELLRTGNGASFDAMMAMQARGNGEQVAAGYDWASVGRVADIGGGTGVLLRILLAEHHRLHGILFDQPQVVEGIEPEPRLDVIAGDLFADPLPRADVHVLSRILHGWPDQDAARILNRCAAVADRVLLVETLLPTEPSADQASFDLFMLALTGGRERTLADFERLGAACGLTRCTATPLESGSSLVELAR